MKRLFWLGVGIAAGVMVTRRVGAAARSMTPGGMAEHLGDAVQDLAGAIGSFGADVRAGMAEREAELHHLVDEQTGISIGSGAGRHSADRAGQQPWADRGRAATGRASQAGR
jgi:chromosome condensin MukBEF MukE localization factor